MIPSPYKILIVLVAGIGDLVLASKSIRAIRNGLKDADIELLTSTDVVPLAKNYPHIDSVHAFPIRELRANKRQLIDILHMMIDMHKREFDRVLNLYRVSSPTGALKMGLLFSLLRARQKIGHDRHGFGRFIDVSLPASTFEGRHVVEAMQEIAIKAGGIPDDLGIEVYWNPEAETKWRSFFDSIEGKILIGINPGGDRANRRWAPDRFAAVAARLVERFDARIVVLGGPGDREIASSIAQAIPSGVSELSGTIPLEELPYLISRLDLLLTNDSGPMHIAAATKTPLVALFGPEDPKLFGPYTTPDLYRVIRKDAPCRPCRERNCPRPTCLERITQDEVFAACLEMRMANSH